MNETIALVLLTTGALRFQPESPLTFKSGLVSPVYVDNRILQAYPTEWRIIIETLADNIRQLKDVVDVIVGVATAGIPHSAALAYQMRKASAFVRKEPKVHGTGRLIEGADVAEKHVVLIEDMVTTGQSSLGAVEVLRESKARVDHCFAITSYGFATERFVAAGVELHPLVTFDVLLAAAVRGGYLAAADRPVIENWLSDPDSWAERYGFS